jgi:hypothetical protein
MAYNITLTNGNLLATIADGTVNTTSTPLTLVGKNYANYGQFLNTNYVRMLENWNNDSEPTNALEGQLWWDSAGSGGNLKVLTGTDWRTIGSITANATAPQYPVTGAGWWDTVNNQLGVYDGGDWVVVGPAFTSTGGSVTPEQITDNTDVAHNVLSVNIGVTRVGIISKDATFTPQTVISGFSQVKPGFQLASGTDFKFQGNTTNSDQLGNIAAANYARNDVDSFFTGVVVVNNANGLKVGTSNNFIIKQSGTTSLLFNNYIDADTKIQANVGGVPFDAITINGEYGSTTIANLQLTGALETTGYIQTTQGSQATSNATGALRVVGGIGLTGNIFTSNSIQANGNVTVLGNLYSGNANVTSYLFINGTENATSNVTGAVRILGGMSVQGNIRCVGNVRGDYIIGSSITALYADLAERFEADAYYSPGTVLTMGGSAEVTLEDRELSDDILGVVSTKAGYLMNAAAGDDDTHPPIAVTGRVPVRAIGQVRKGDRLVSAGNGLARVAKKSEITPFNVIGRALENKYTEDEDLVLCIVKLNS